MHTRRLGLTLAGVALLSGCLGDPPPDPDIQPLEIVVGHPDPDHDQCLLNVEEVGAGTHEVTPVTTAGKARVRILDPEGAVLFERTVHPAPPEGEEGEVVLEDPEAVRLEEGGHRVECIVADRRHSTGLRVVPAEPGNP
ncbi:MAG: hypothetical protein ACLGH4_02660 [Actinomycetes bacterium]